MSAVSDLRIMRRLDRSKLSKEAIEFFESKAGGNSSTFVDTNTPRDYVWTDEIILATVDFCIADSDGEILKEGFASIAEAENARSGAKLSFKLELPGESLED